MHVAVIGAKGFIGSRLCTALTAAAHRVTAVSSASGAFDPDTGLLRGDALPPADVDAVVYLSQSPRYRDVPRHAAHLWAVNVVSPLIAAEWARRHGARRFIYASSGTVYRPAFHPLREDDPLRRDRGYALSKVHAEEALDQFGPDLRVSCARLFGVYGPAQRGKLIPNLVERIQSGGTVDIQPHPDRREDDEGGVRLSLIHVDDAVDTIVALLQSDSTGPINIASSEVLSIRDIATAIGDCLGVTPSFCVSAAGREGDVIADCSRLLAMRGRPFVSFRAAIARVVEARGSAS